MASGIDRDQQRKLDLFPRPAVDIIGVGRHRLADFLVQQPDVEASVVNLGCRLAVNGDLVAPALGGDVLPMTPIEPAAIGEVAAVEYTMQLRLRTAPVVEAVIRDTSLSAWSTRFPPSAGAADLSSSISLSRLAILILPACSSSARWPSCSRAASSSAA